MFISKRSSTDIKNHCIVALPSPLGWMDLWMHDRLILRLASKMCVQPLFWLNPNPSNFLGEEALPGCGLPQGGSRRQRHPQDQRGPDSYGVSLRDAVLRAQPYQGGPQRLSRDSKVLRHVGEFLQLFFFSHSNAWKRNRPLNLQMCPRLEDTTSSHHGMYKWKNIMWNKKRNKIININYCCSLHVIYF